MEKSLGGELAFLIVTGLNAAQSSPPTILRAWLLSYHYISLPEKEESILCSFKKNRLWGSNKDANLQHHPYSVGNGKLRPDVLVVFKLEGH